jgi:phage FluMu gp28-like protein
VTLDDALAQGLYRKICETLEREWSRDAEAEWRREIFELYADNSGEELMCIPRASSGTFLSALAIEARMREGVPVLRWSAADEFASRSEEIRRSETAAWCEDRLAPALEALDSSLATCFGEDFGRSGDLTVIWVMQIARNLTRRTAIVVELRNLPFRQQEQVLFYLADRLPRFIAGAMDARGNGQYLAETAAQRYGARIAQVMLSPEWYRENMPRYKAAFEDGAIELPRDADILADHRAIVLDDGIAKVGDSRFRGSDGMPRHGDSAIAAALAFAASRLETAEIAYTPVKGASAVKFGAGAW